MAKVPHPYPPVDVTLLPRLLRRPLRLLAVPCVQKQKCVDRSLTAPCVEMDLITLILTLVVLVLVLAVVAKNGNGMWPPSFAVPCFNVLLRVDLHLLPPPSPRVAVP